MQDHKISNGQRQKHLLNQTDHSQNLSPFVVFGLPEHCTNFQFPPPPSVLRHRRDISTFLDIFTVYTIKTIYFLNAYHLGLTTWTTQTTWTTSVNLITWNHKPGTLKTKNQLGTKTNRPVTMKNHKKHLEP